MPVSPVEEVSGVQGHITILRSVAGLCVKLCLKTKTKAKSPKTSTKGMHTVSWPAFGDWEISPVFFHPLTRLIVPS